MRYSIVLYNDGGSPFVWNAVAGINSLCACLSALDLLLALYGEYILPKAIKAEELHHD